MMGTEPDLQAQVAAPCWGGGGWGMVRVGRDGSVRDFDGWGDSLKLAGLDEYFETNFQ